MTHAITFPVAFPELTFQSYIFSLYFTVFRISYSALVEANLFLSVSILHNSLFHSFSFHILILRVGRNPYSLFSFGKFKFSHRFPDGVNKCRNFSLMTLVVSLRVSLTRDPFQGSEQKSGWAKHYESFLLGTWVGENEERRDTERSSSIMRSWKLELLGKPREELFSSSSFFQADYWRWCDWEPELCV